MASSEQVARNVSSIGENAALNTRDSCPFKSPIVTRPVHAADAESRSNACQGSLRVLAVFTVTHNTVTRNSESHRTRGHVHRHVAAQHSLRQPAILAPDHALVPALQNIISGLCACGHRTARGCRSERAAPAHTWGGRIGIIELTLGICRILV